MKLRFFAPVKTTGTQNDKFHFFRRLPGFRRCRTQRNSREGKFHRAEDLPAAGAPPELFARLVRISHKPHGVAVELACPGPQPGLRPLRYLHNCRSAASVTL
jgi:hypothetical protein